jgi:eukaryotic-like serine/threonine-protein kinase
MIMWQELQPDDPGRIGPYRLRGVLGSGGMGRVFLAASADGQLVAVKVIRANLGTDPEFRARFDREVTVARRVSSRFTVPLIDADTDAPVPWLATAYVAGPSLADPGRELLARAQRFPVRGCLAGSERIGAAHLGPHPGGVLKRPY